MQEARLYHRKDHDVNCALCCHRCLIKPGRRGICGVRENRDGTLFTLVYGHVSAEHVDPVEKKPLFHFLPGSLTYSLATVGCNFKCLHCQNYSLSQAGLKAGDIPHVTRTPQQVVEAALLAGCRSISFTYSEPTVFFEFAFDCCQLARQHGLKTIFVSNGYMTPETAHLLIPVLDAINIDVKSFSDEFYRAICGGRLQQVLDNVRLFQARGVWVEVTSLIIPGLNDSDEEIRSIAGFVASCDKNIPWHVSAFRPTYQMLDRIPTSPERLRSAREIGRGAGLNHVYIGNIRDHGGEDTCCPSCGATLMRRSGFMTTENSLVAGRCPSCEEAVSGVW